MIHRRSAYHQGGLIGHLQFKAAVVVYRRSRSAVINGAGRCNPYMSHLQGLPVRGVQAAFYGDPGVVPVAGDGQQDKNGHKEKTHSKTSG